MQKKAGKFPRLFMLSLVSFCAWFSANRAAPLFMGHKSPMRVLKHYQHVKNNQKKSVMENLPQPSLTGSLI